MRGAIIFPARDRPDFGDENVTLKTMTSARVMGMIRIVRINSNPKNRLQTKISSASGANRIERRKWEPSPPEINF